MTMTDDQKKEMFMNGVRLLSDIIDKGLNGPQPEPETRQIGFIILVFPLNVEGGCTIASNGIDQRDVFRILKEQSVLLEAQLPKAN